TYDAARFGVFVEIAEDGHVKISCRVERAHDIICAIQGFGGQRIRKAPACEFVAELFAGVDERPRDEGYLLWRHEVGIGEMREIFADVAGGVAPAAMEIDAAVAAIQQDVAVGL